MDAVDSAENPLLAPSALPLGYPPFDRIRDEHVAPAFEAALAEHAAEIEAVAANPDAPTFANTIIALERSGRTLDRVSAYFHNLVATDATETRLAIEREYAPRLAAHLDALYLDQRLWRRIDALAAAHAAGSGEDLDDESARLLRRRHRDVRRRGAALDTADRDRLRALNSRLAVLTTAFGENLLADTGARAVHLTDPADLAGLDDATRAALAAAAAERGLDGWVIPLGLPTIQPLLTDLASPAVRRRVHAASLARGTAATDAAHQDDPTGTSRDNSAVALEIVLLRAERAELLGYANHAEYVIEVETAGSVAAARGLLLDLLPAAATNAAHEAEELLDIPDPGGTDPAACTADPALAPWDWPRRAELLRAERHAFDAHTLRPYLSLERVLRDGVFHAAHLLYGITVTERHDLPVYHPSVRTWDVTDADGTALAILVTDLYARPTKRGGAWMSSFVGQSRLLGTRAVVVNVLGITPPAAGEDALLSLDEVVTLFHEFGHALHGLLSDVTYPTFSGTSVPRDFVEFPSQLNEMWALHPDILAAYARHHRTGAAMPADLVDEVLAARRFGAGFATTEFIAAAVIDLAWHSLTAAQARSVTDVGVFEATALAEAGLDPELPLAPRYRTTYFNHVFAGGYSAAYYSYLWAEVLDADASEWLAANGGATRANGELLREHILSRGGTLDYAAAYRTMRGADPDRAALLRRRGL